MEQEEFSPEKTRKAIYGEGIIHLVASGFNKTFCGLDADKVKHTSLGMCCNCEECSKEAQKILDKQLNSESISPPKAKARGIQNGRTIK